VELPPPIPGEEAPDICPRGAADGVASRGRLTVPTNRAALSMAPDARAGFLPPGRTRSDCSVAADRPSLTRAAAGFCLSMKSCCSAFKPDYFGGLPTTCRRVTAL